MTEQDFKAWEKEAFGFGYGSGERPIINVMRKFFKILLESKNGPMIYDYSVLEYIIGNVETWMLINVFCKNGIIDYGTSTRFGWLTEKGEELAVFMNSHSEDDMYDILMRDEAPNELKFDASVK